MITALVAALIATPVGLTAVLALDGVTQWFGKSLWGRLDPSSRILTLCATGAILLGVGVTVSGFPADTVTRGVVWGTTAVFVFAVALQVTGLIKDQRRYGRHRSVRR